MNQQPINVTYSPITVIVNVTFAELDEASTAVYVTIVSPIEKVDPELWLDVKFTEPELSLAVGSDHVTTAVDEPTSVLWIISDGIPLIAGISSSIWTHCYQKKEHPEIRFKYWCSVIKEHIALTKLSSKLVKFLTHSYL